MQLVKFFLTCKNYILFSKKNTQYWVLKVLCLETKMVCSGWLKNDSLFLRFSAHQNVVFLVDAMDWDLTYEDLIKKTVWNTESNKCIVHQCESCPGTGTVNKILDQQLNKDEDDGKFNYCQWETTDRAILTTFRTTYEEYKEALIDVIDNLTRHSYITKLKITSSWYRTKYKATTGVKNTASHIFCS